MTLALKQGGTSDVSDPRIVFVYIEPRVGSEPEDDAGYISDVESLTYRVVRSNGTELVPTTAVDLVAHRVRQGTYAPPITIGASDPRGDYTVTWVAERVAGEQAFTWTTTFRVISASEPYPNGYVLLSEMRKAGVPAGICDEDVLSAVERASRYVENVTRRFFEPRYLTTQHDGRGRGVLLQLDDPIIGLEELEITFSDFRPISRLVDRSQVRVYNRHIRPTPLLNPDDRDNPKVEFLRVDNELFNAPRFPPLTARFTSAQQNVELTGWFGYTDPDGSPLGKTPELLKRVVMMVAMRDIRPLWRDFSAGRRGGAAGPIASEKTRDQSVSYASGATAGGVSAAGWITGDAEIDNLLSTFVGPMSLGAV